MLRGREKAGTLAAGRGIGVVVLSLAGQARAEVLEREPCHFFSLSAPLLSGVFLSESRGRHSFFSVRFLSNLASLFFSLQWRRSQKTSSPIWMSSPRERKRSSSRRTGAAWRRTAMMRGKATATTRCDWVLLLSVLLQPRPLAFCCFRRQERVERSIIFLHTCLEALTKIHKKRKKKTKKKKTDVRRRRRQRR